MANVLVLGAGMVGSVMAADLSRDAGLTVTVADVSETNLERAAHKAGGRVRTVRADLSDAATITKLARANDVVLGALASRLGLAALRAVIASGKPYCDISFMAEDALELSEFARTAGVCAVVDMGVAPGMSNLLAGYAAKLLSPCDSIEIYVGGLPRLRTWPFDYKAAFAPADVIEEYTRPSRIVENGKVVVRPALSEPELMDLPGVGTVEAFNTDGLRSIAATLRVPNMKEKTLRYPGHIALMRAFRETGLFSQEPIDVGGVKVRPLEVTSKLLFPKWTYEEGEQDLTVMRVTATGLLRGSPTRLTWDLLDLFDPATGFTSMSRTTAFPATITARLLLSGKLSRPGVHTPELLAEQWLVEHLMQELKARGVTYTFRQDPIEQKPA